MIVCDDFVFLHLHKSGGTFVNELIMRCLPRARLVGYHLPYSQIPDACRDLPVLGLVRNPFAYYVSWYHYQSGQAQPNALFRICSENKTLDFVGTIGNLVALEGDSARIDALIDAFPAQFVNHGLNLTKGCIDTLRGSGRGFYSFLYERLYRGPTDLTLVQMENLRPGLTEFLNHRLNPPKALALQFIAQVPPLNTTRHGPYRQYYSAELRDLITRLDAPVISRHGYSF